MSKLEVRLPGGSLDLSPNSQSKFYITKQIHDIKNLETRKASFSKTLIIPRTENNVNLLGVELIEFGRDFDDSYSFVDCEVLLASYPILGDGKLIVTSQNYRDKTITLNIFGGTVTLFEALSDNGINELPLSEFAFDWTLNNIKNYSNTTEGFLFGQSTWFSNDNYVKALDKGLSPDAKLEDPDINYCGGWFYVKTLMNKIFEGMPQLEIDNSALEALDDYDKMVVMIPSTQLFDNFTALEGIEGVRNAPTNTETSDLITNQAVNLDFPTEYEDNPAGLWDSGGSFPYRYEAQTSAYYNVNINIVARMSPPSSALSKLTVIAGQDFVYQELGSLQLGFSNQNLVINKSVFLNAGETVRISFLAQNTQFGIPIKCIYDGDFNIKSSITIDSDFVNLSEWMPDISQKDLVKEVFKFFHAIPTFKDGVTTISLWDNIAEREQKDLTQYLDENKEIVEQGYLPTYGQENKFAFELDDDVLISTNDFSFQMKNEILPSEKTKIQSKFSTSDPSVAGNDLILSAPLFPFDFEKITNNNITVTASTDTYTTVESNDLKVGDIIIALNNPGTGVQRRRVKQVIDNKNGTVDLNWSVSSSNIWDKVNYDKQELGLRFGKAFDLGETTIRDGGLFTVSQNMKGVSFPEAYGWDSLVNSYYSNLVSMLEKPNVKQEWFRLPPTVFNELNLLNPIYLKDRSYYLNKIEQYNYSGFCRMELIEFKVNKAFDAMPFYIATPNPLDFGNVDESTTTSKKISIFNTGDSTIQFNINPITGSSSSYFSFNPSISNPITLLPGGVREVFIDFISDNSFGYKEAQFQIQGLTDGLFNINVELGGFITSGSNYTVEPTTVLLAQTPNGSQSVVSTTVKNTGIGAIDFELSSISGSNEFEYAPGTPLSFTLLPGQQTGVGVRFNSISPNGVKEASFVIETISPNIFNKTIQVFGETVSE